MCHFTSHVSHIWGIKLDLTQETNKICYYKKNKKKNRHNRIQQMFPNRRSHCFFLLWLVFQQDVGQSIWSHNDFNNFIGKNKKRRGVLVRCVNKHHSLHSNNSDTTCSRMSACLHMWNWFYECSSKGKLDNELCFCFLNSLSDFRAPKWSSYSGKKGASRNPARAKHHFWRCAAQKKFFLGNIFLDLTLCPSTQTEQLCDAVSCATLSAVFVTFPAPPEDASGGHGETLAEPKPIQKNKEDLQRISGGTTATRLIKNECETAAATDF